MNEDSMLFRAVLSAYPGTTIRRRQEFIGYEIRRADGELLQVGEELSEREMIRNIGSFLSGVEEPQTLELGDGLSDDDKRIKEIQDELDILRGRVPTPKGYKIDRGRAKELMAELKLLTAKVAV